MSTMHKFGLLITLVFIFTCAMAGCVSSSAKEDNKQVSSVDSTEVHEMSEFVFYGSVLEAESEFGGILVKPEGDTLPNELVVHSSEMPELSVGDRVKVEYGGQITLSLPGQVYGAKVTVSP